jgi:elongation factor G
MKNYSTKNIINFTLAGDASTGKKMLTEIMAFNAGITNRIGTIEDGNTIFD